MNYGQKNAANGVPGLDGSGFINPAQIHNLDPLNILPNTVDVTVFGYLANVTSDIQTQINNIVNGGVTFEAAATATANINIASPGSTNWDGYTPTVGDTLFLLPAASGGFQTTASQGGLYTYNGATNPLTRYSGMSTWAQVVGSRVYVDSQAGASTFGGTAWINTNNLGGTLGTTAITYQQQQNSYVAGTNLTLTGNVFATVASPSFTSETLTANTNFMTTGTTNPMTWTQAAQSAPHTLTLPDANSNTVQPTTITAGSAVQFIDNNGLQNLMVIINQVLTGFAAAPGTITAADSILQAIQKNAGNLTALTPGIVHQSANYQFLAANTTVIMDSDAKTGTLPAANAVGVIPGVTYTLKLGTGASTGTLAVPSGGTLDGTLNGTFTITGAWNSASAQSDGTAWFTV